jgi:hypothetical protein
MAKRRGIAGWKWGIPAGILMYLLVFWDHIPTVVAHRYYCDKEAGFAINKTLEQWKSENPGVAETLSSSKISPLEVIGNTRIARLNERFHWQTVKERVFLSLVRTDRRIVDVNNGNILAKHIDFRTGWGNFPVDTEGLSSFKLWLKNKSCEEEGKRVSAKGFSQFENSVEHIGERK